MSQISQVFILAEEPLIRTTLRLLIAANSNFVLTGEAAFIDDLSSFTRSECSQILLHGAGGGSEEICDSLIRLRRHIARVKVIAFLDSSGQLSSVPLLIHELSACLFKYEITESLNSIIQLVAQGNTWFSRAVVEKLLKQENEICLEKVTPTLTKRERQVLELVVKGQSNLQIAASLNLAEQTVRNYISQVYDKLNLPDRTAAIVQFRKFILH